MEVGHFIQIFCKINSPGFINNLNFYLVKKYQKNNVIIVRGCRCGILFELLKLL